MRDMHYSTSDIYFAAYLCATGRQMTGAEESHSHRGGRGRKVVFCFDLDVEGGTAAKTEFCSGNTSVNVRKFIESFRYLKSICHI